MLTPQLCFLQDVRVACSDVFASFNVFYCTHRQPESIPFVKRKVTVGNTRVFNYTSRCKQTLEKGNVKGVVR